MVNLEHIRAIIKADQFVLFDSVDSDNFHQSLFVFDLQERLRNTGPENLPYELRAFEAILVSVLSVLRDQLQKISPKVHSLLRRLETNARIDRDTLLDILDLSKKLTKLESRVTNVHQTLTELLNSDSDMADMYLTIRKETGQARPSHLHQVRHRALLSLPFFLLLHRCSVPSRRWNLCWSSMPSSWKSSGARQRS